MPTARKSYDRATWSGLHGTSATSTCVEGRVKHRKKYPSGLSRDAKSLVLLLLLYTLPGEGRSPFRYCLLFFLIMAFQPQSYLGTDCRLAILPLSWTTPVLGSATAGPRRPDLYNDIEQN